MAGLRHPAASDELPSFITAPGETDVLMVVMSLFIVLAVVMFGILFLRLHTLPERMAHKSHKIQFEIVAVLGLIALFTHMHIFWIAGLLLAMIDVPDFGNSLGRIAASTEKIAGIKPSNGAAELQPETSAVGIEQPREAAGVQLERCEAAREGDGGVFSPLIAGARVSFAYSRKIWWLSLDRCRHASQALWSRLRRLMAHMTIAGRRWWARQKSRLPAKEPRS
jgi:hypothetical protein